MNYLKQNKSKDKGQELEQLTLLFRNYLTLRVVYTTHYYTDVIHIPYVVMSRIIYFEIQADDINRAIQFYKKVFGSDFKQLDNMEYCLIITGPEDQRGINGGLMRRIVPI